MCTLNTSFQWKKKRCLLLSLKWSVITVTVSLLTISNYWMRLSRIWRILQIKEGVIHRGRRPRWITRSEICRIITLLFIQNIFSLRSLFFCSPNITQPCPQVFSVNGSIICSRLHFWRHRFNNFRWAALLTSLIQYGEDCFQIWWTAAGYGELCVWF